MENYDVLDRIIPLFDDPASFNKIEALLCSGSNLPGPRGNLTLADKFADCFAREDISNELLEMLCGWSAMTVEEAPVNTPFEFLPFCGVLALGAHYISASLDVKKRIMEIQRAAMNSQRWRTREAVAMSFQRIAERDFDPVRSHFDLWYTGSSNLEKRAFIAALAHPPILGDEKIAAYSLEMGRKIMTDILENNKSERHMEDFAVLSQGLQYAFSVFVAFRPEEGFELLARFAAEDDKEILKIVKSNLNKARLVKKFPSKVETILNILK